jgi:hypothetical protein
MKNTLPITSSAGFATSQSARGPETITASVPFSAPPDAAADGAIDLHDLLRSQQAVNPRRHLRADGREVDEAPDALALDHAAGAGRDLQRGLQRRQARQHGSQRSAMSFGDDAGTAPSAMSLSTASFRVSNTVN